MRKFLRTILKFFIVPLILLFVVVIGYFVFDPFRILYSHDNYSHTHSDRNYYTIEMFKKQYKQYKYNSFIFGSSRTLAFHPNSWCGYLDNGASVYSMDGYGETLYGMYHKINYLDSLDVDIKNALILIDVPETFGIGSETPRRDFVLFYQHPDVDGSSWYELQRDHFLLYMNANLIASYYLNKFFGVRNKYIYEYIGNIRASVNHVTNELRREDLELQIKTDPTYHDNPIFNYQISDTLVVIPPTIKKLHQEWLSEMKSIFDKYHTDYKIIIGPMYFKTKFSDTDLKILINIFGQDRVYDFSGVNDFTTNKKNYYETSHYRPLVGDSIMHYIYTHPGNVEVK